MTALPNPDLAFLLALIGSTVIVTLYLHWQNKTHDQRENHEDDNS